MTKHTPEPWSVDPNDQREISPADDMRFGIASACNVDPSETPGKWFFGPRSQANARRIVACVNACAGLPTEVLERYKLGVIGVDYKSTKQQRDELLAAIKKFLDENNPEGFGCACEPDRLCGPCSEAKRQRPLYAAIATVKEK